ncbi:MAG: transglutaminase family protein [Bacteroidota bacterium]
MVSEYKSWKEVNDWAMDLFPVVTSISPPLQKKIAEIKTQNNTAEQRVLAALRFVQDDIRYMGIEMGENSHKPAHPNKIFTQRFGDCKDKSYLLCTILRSLEVQADPVLINTYRKKTIADRLPSSKSFDHVTVRVQLNNKYYWFDPTISFQRGPVHLISYPDYQCGLVIHPDTDALTMIGKKEPGLVAINEVFDIPDMSGMAKLVVTTRYTGSFADDMRSGI